MKTSLLFACLLLSSFTFSQETPKETTELKQNRSEYGNHTSEKEAYYKEFNAFIIKKKGTLTISQEEKLQLREEFNATRNKK